MSLAPSTALSGPAYILQQAHERKLQTIELWVSDASDRLHVLTLPIDHLEEVLNEGLALEGPLALPFREYPEQELRLQPDPETFRFLFERSPRHMRARLICEVVREDGQASPLCPRALLAATVAHIAREGVRFEVQATLAHRWLKGAPEGPALPPRAQLHDETAALLSQLGIPWQSLYDHELDGWQGHTFVSFERLDARTLADSWVSYRQMMRELARGHQGQVTWEHFSAEGYSELSLSREALHPETPQGFGEAALNSLGEKCLHLLSRELPALSLLLRSSPQNYIQTLPLRVSPRLRQHEQSLLSLVLSNADPCTPPYTSLSALLMLAQQSTRSDSNEALPKRMPSTLTEACEAAQSSALLKPALGAPIFEHLLSQGYQRATRSGYRASSGVSSR